MPQSGKTFGIAEGTDILVVYPVGGGQFARFQPGTVKAARRFDAEDRLYEPARLLEGIPLAELLAQHAEFSVLAKPEFEALLMAVAGDALGEHEANRLTVFKEGHHLVVVDTNRVVEV